MIQLFLPLLVGVSLLLAGWLLMGWFTNADPARLARGLYGIAAVLVLLIGVGLALVGALVPAGALTVLSLWLWRRRGARPTRERASTVRTALLEAWLDHGSGEIDAQVLAGQFEGRRLSALSDEAVMSLWHEAGSDNDSRLLLEAYLDRRRPHWREDVEGDADGGARGAAGAGEGGPMTTEEAYQILGLAPGASEAEVRTAHRRLMQQMHPDQGGSTFLAAKLNEARDVLLRRR